MPVLYELSYPARMLAVSLFCQNLLFLWKHVFFKKKMTQYFLLKSIFQLVRMFGCFFNVYFLLTSAPSVFNLLLEAHLELIIWIFKLTCHGQAVKRTIHALKLRGFWSAECGFESPSWHLCPWANWKQKGHSSIEKKNVKKASKIFCFSENTYSLKKRWPNIFY